MSNINLYQDSHDEDIKKNLPKLIDGGFFFSIGLIVLVLGVLVGLKMYNSSLQSKDIQLQEKLAIKIKEIGSSNVNKLADFNYRSQKIGVILSERENAVSHLWAIEDSIASGSYADRISLDSNLGEVAIDLNSGSFEGVARQLLSFKDSKSFGNVGIDGASRGEGFIGFTLNMNLNNKTKK